MYQHGGHYEHYLSKRRVTHIIATSLPNSKITKGLKHCKVVKPEWITERYLSEAVRMEADKSAVALLYV